MSLWHQLFAIFYFWINEHLNIYAQIYTHKCSSSSRFLLASACHCVVEFLFYHISHIWNINIHITAPCLKDCYYYYVSRTWAAHIDIHKTANIRDRMRKKMYILVDSYFFTLLFKRLFLCVYLYTIIHSIPSKSIILSSSVNGTHSFHSILYIFFSFTLS